MRHHLVRTALALLGWAMAGQAALAHSDIMAAFPPLPQVAPLMPPTPLTSSTQGEIRFNSGSPYDMDVLLQQGNKATPTSGGGRLYLPAGASEVRKVPAMVILPGITGAAHDSEFATAETLARHGIAALVVDYDKPRGVTPEMSYRDRMLVASEFDVVTDAYAALRALNVHPSIDPQRIGVMGFARGGMVARMTMDARFRQVLAPNVPPFALHVDFYGPCYAQLHTRKTTGTPLVSFRAAEDASSDLVACANEEVQLRQAGSAVSTVVYAKAAHAWNSHLPRAMDDRPYLTGCTIQFTEQALPAIRGNTLIPPDAAYDRETRYRLRAQASQKLGDCVKFGVLTGHDDETTDQANKQLLQFLKTRFALPPSGPVH